MEFIRYGSLVPQDHNITDDIFFHTPPVRKGFYAFPKGYVEGFLLGGKGEGSVKNGRYSYIRDEKGNKIYCTGDEEEEYIEKMCKKNKKYLTAHITRETPNFEDTHFATMPNDDPKRDVYGKYWDWLDEQKFPLIIENKPNYFNYNGLVWHHLYDDNIIKDKYYPHYIKHIRTWVLSDIRTFEKCLKREVGKCKHSSVYYGTTNGTSGQYYVEGKYGGYPIHHFDKDLFEVYIESLQK